MFPRILSRLIVLFVFTAPAFAQGASSVDVLPPAPTAKTPVTVLVKTACPSLFKAPQIGAGSGERLVRIVPNLDGPQPLGPCHPAPNWEYRFQLGALAPGQYRVQVQGEGPGGGQIVEAEKRFEVAPSGGPLRLHAGRFELHATWRNAQGQAEGAEPVALTSQTGYVWFFSPENVEIVAKVLNGCATNHRWWVFLAGMTDLPVEITVKDTATGKTKVYRNPAGRPFQTVLDTAAFASCE